MCTFTAIVSHHKVADNKKHKKIRISFNRDELRSRPEGTNPEFYPINDVLCIMPVDTSSGGTWIGINNRGLFFGLLNVNVRRMDETQENLSQENMNTYVSRGGIIPGLIGCESFQDVSQRLENFSVINYRGFKLVFIDCVNMKMGFLIWDGANKELAVQSWSGDPVFHTSSGLGDDYVFPHRNRLFRDMFAGFDGSGIYERKQDEFHSHFWRDRRDVSVNMERGNALTVSRSIVEIFDSHIQFTHYMPPFTEHPEILEMSLK